MVRDTTVWTLAVVILFIAMVLPGLNAAGNDNTELQTVEQEPVTVDYDSPTAVDPPNEAFGFEGGATVFNTSGAELVNGTDYEWHPSNGTITWFDTTETTDGETGSATYEFSARTERTRGINGVMAILAQVWPLLILFAGVGAAMKYGSPW